MKILMTRLLDLTGKLTVQEFIEVIRDAKLVVSNDSASVHIAYALGVKSFFALVEDGIFGRFVPCPESINDKFKLYFF